MKWSRKLEHRRVFLIRKEYRLNCKNKHWTPRSPSPLSKAEQQEFDDLQRISCAHFDELFEKNQKKKMTE